MIASVTHGRITRTVWSASVAFLAVIGASGCRELTSSEPIVVSIRSTSGATAIPDTMFDSEKRDVAITIKSSRDSAAIASIRVSWSSSADTILAVSPGRSCSGETLKGADARLHACVEARGAGHASLTVHLEQAGLASSDTLDTTFPVQVNQKWTKVAAGRGASCALNVRRAVYCWGDEVISGRAGASDPSLPAPIFNPSRLQFDSLFLGGYSACGTARGTRLAYCWGYNFHGAAGIGPSITKSIVPTPLLGVAIDYLALGENAACDISGDLASANYSCWGWDTGSLQGWASAQVLEQFGFSPVTTPCQSQIDVGDLCFYTPGLSAPTNIPPLLLTLPRFFPITSPTPIKDYAEYVGYGFVSMRAIGVGMTHACGVSRVNVLACWGENGSRQLGLTKLYWNAFAFFQVPAGRSDSVSLSLGGDHSCLRVGRLASDGEVYCWGENAYGQSGPFVGGGCPSTYDTPGLCTRAPQLIPGTYMAIAAGDDHTCGLKASGRVFCWGNSLYGALGIPQNQIIPFAHPDAVAVQFDASILIDQLASGAHHACGLRRRDGAVWCWGSNGQGESGVNTRPATGVVATNTTVYTPVRLREPAANAAASLHAASVETPPPDAVTRQRSP